jgi:DNA-binding transcriptional MerR regulator
MSDKSHMSIGEVLTLLQREFPDVTISKIRFLESQGLLDPERTPSGYRKFYDDDIARLRWILRQQRENFLPLKVIKDRLDETPAGQVPADVRAPVPEPVAAGGGGGGTAAAVEANGSATKPTTGSSRRAAAGKSAAVAAVAAASGPALLDPEASTANMTVDELASASGLDGPGIAELERYGLVVGRAVGPDVLYGEDALVVAKLAARFRQYGVEARHLRMYRTGAEREASFFEQVVMPMLKQRNPTARRQAYDTIGELAELGESLRAAMLRQALREYAGPR